jgi:hypothetical protein
MEFYKIDPSPTRIAGVPSLMSVLGLSMASPQPDMNPGIDLMKHFRQKFTDKNLFCQISMFVLTYDLTLL